MPACPNCGWDNRSAARFCLACGMALPAPSRVGAGPLRVTKLEKVGEADGNRAPLFCWSPVRDVLAWVRPTEGKPQPGILELVVVTALDYVTLPVGPVDPWVAPVWSPSGRAIAFTDLWDGKVLSAQAPDFDLAGLRLFVKDGGIVHAQPLTWGEDTADSRPAWSPDEQLLLYYASVKATGQGEWRLLDLATKQIVRLDGAQTVSWSPDGHRFASLGADMVRVWHGLHPRIRDRAGQLVAEIETPYGFADFAGHGEWLDAQRLIIDARWTGILPDAGGIILLDLRTQTGEILLKAAHSFCVSPDRRWCAADASRRSDEGDRDSRIVEGVAVVSAADLSVTRLHSTDCACDWGALWNAFQLAGWSPDSAKVLFVREHNVWVVNINDTGLQRLAEGGTPRWSPSGRCIAFLRSPQPGKWELWLMWVEAA